MWGFLIGTIISVAMAIDNAYATKLANDRNNSITKAASKIYQQITKDRGLYNRLLDAYNRRDNALAAQIISSSPFGSRVRKLKDAVKDNQSNISKTTKDLNNLDAKQTQIDNEVQQLQTKHQTSGSAIIDLIHGAAKDPDTSNLNYKPSNITEQTVQEVNYGQK